MTVEEYEALKDFAATYDLLIQKDILNRIQKRLKIIDMNKQKTPD